MFIDLKKLIKYENRRRQKDSEEAVQSPNLVTANLCHCPYVQAHINRKQDILTDTKSGKHCCDHPFCPHNLSVSKQKEEEPEDVFRHLHSQHTVASRAKEVPRKEKHISVHIRKPKNKTDIYDHYTQRDSPNDENEEKGDLQLIQNIETVSDGSKLYVNTESTIKTTEATSKQSLATKPSTSKKKSKCSCMLPRYH